MLKARRRKVNCAVAIGVYRFSDVTREIAESLNLPKAEGAQVARVEPGSPAEKGGVEAGDIAYRNSMAWQSWNRVVICRAACGGGNTKPVARVDCDRLAQRVLIA